MSGRAVGARVFQSYSGRWYAYQIDTNSMLALDPLSAAILHSRGDRQRDRLRRIHGDKAVRDRLLALDRFCPKRSGFDTEPLWQIGLPCDEEELLRVHRRGLRHAVLVLTRRCNLRCRYCVYSPTYPEYGGYEGGAMPWTVARAAIDLLLAHSGRARSVHLGFYGGEPLLRLSMIRRCVAYAEAARGGRRVRYHVTTNGVLLDDAVLRFLIDHDFFLSVSLDGPQEEHDRHRVFADGRGSWRAVSRALQRIRELDPRYFRRRVSLVCVASAQADLERVVRFFRTRGSWVDGLDITINSERVPEAATNGSALRSPANRRTLAALREEFVDAVVAGRKLTDHGVLRSLFVPGLYRIHTRRRARADKGGAPTLGQCIPGGKEFAVFPDGGIHACVNMPPGSPIGNVATGLDMKLSLELLGRFSRAMAPACRHCWAVSLCGMCAVGMRAGGDGACAARCRVERVFLTDALRLYATILERNPGALDAFFSSA